MVAVRRRRRLRHMRRSSRSGFLFDELMMEAAELHLQQAITTIAQSDPLIKLMQQVRMGRMKETDPGLRAVIESWLTTYRKVVGAQELTRQALKRINPAARVDLLIEAGILAPDHPVVIALRTEFEQALLHAGE